MGYYRSGANLKSDCEAILSNPNLKIIQVKNNISNSGAAVKNLMIIALY